MKLLCTIHTWTLRESIASYTHEFVLDIYSLPLFNFFPLIFKHLSHMTSGPLKCSGLLPTALCMEFGAEDLAVCWECTNTGQWYTLKIEGTMEPERMYAGTTVQFQYVAYQFPSQALPLFSTKS